jgi:hypothetical protein
MTFFVSDPNFDYAEGFYLTSDGLRNECIIYFFEPSFAFISKASHQLSVAASLTLRRGLWS